MFFGMKKKRDHTFKPVSVSGHLTAKASGNSQWLIRFFVYARERRYILDNIFLLLKHLWQKENSFLLDWLITTATFCDIFSLFVLFLPVVLWLILKKIYCNVHFTDTYIAFELLSRRQQTANQQTEKCWFTIYRLMYGNYSLSHA